MKNIYIIAASRTPIGSFMGSLSALSAVELGAESIKALANKNIFEPADIEQVIMGNVLSANLGQAPARQAAIKAGLSKTIPTMTINKVCGSGLKSVMLAADSISLGENLIIAGGMESMSNAPFVMPKLRQGVKYGSAEMLDTILRDGLTDSFSNIPMGEAAELCVEKYNISRQEQDEFAANSYKKAIEATETGVFSNEIQEIIIRNGKTESIIKSDEEPFKVKFEKISSLKPAFKPNGTITAANASSINDGAATLALASEEYIAKIISYAEAATEPLEFTSAPIYAMEKNLKKSNMTINDIDLFEINEAFACVPIAAARQLNIDMEKINIFGGAVALGHPIGASGARVLVTLLNALTTRNKTLAMASLCIGGGEAVSMIIEKMN